jgi:hypothetical protein
MIKFVVRSVLFVAWPLAYLFTAIRFDSVLDHPNLVTYLVIWTLIGVFLGIGNWQKSLRTEDQALSKTS